MFIYLFFFFKHFRKVLHSFNDRNVFDLLLKKIKIRTLIVFVNNNNLRKKKFFVIQQKTINEKTNNQYDILKLIQNCNTR